MDHMHAHTQPHIRPHTHAHTRLALNRSGSDDTEAAPSPSREQPISRALHWSAVSLYPATQINFSVTHMGVCVRTHTLTFTLRDREVERGEWERIVSYSCSLWGLPFQKCSIILLGTDVISFSFDNLHVWRYWFYFYVGNLWHKNSLRWKFGLLFLCAFRPINVLRNVWNVHME